MQHVVANCPRCGAPIPPSGVCAECRPCGCKNRGQLRCPEGQRLWLTLPAQTAPMEERNGALRVYWAHILGVMEATS